MEETFAYDDMDRLTGICLGTAPTGAMAYDGYGRMTSKTAGGNPVFSDAVFGAASKPHALDRAFTPSGTFPSAPQTVSYTGFDKVLKVVEGNDSVVFAYGHDRQRISMEEHVGNTVRTKRYVGNCELVSESSGLLSTERWLTYLTGPTGVYAVVETSGSTNTLHYVLKDNLGSWTTITDSNGNVEQRLSYDAWGNLRNPETWSGSFTGTPMFDRGFTGHEHLYEFGLINMNGRMYDPVMSSFLSPDNYMQCPDNSQNFNRYAYCLNNPLRYTDPSGEVFGLDDMVSFLIMTGVAVTMTVTQNGIGNTLHGRPFFQNAGQPAAMALIQSGFSFGIGEMAMGMGPGAFLFQMGAHATLDGTFTYFQGGDFWKGAAVGVASSFFSSLTNGLTANMDKAWRTVAIISSGTLSGGVTSKIMGGDFIDGAINGFITAGLNHALHQMCKGSSGPDDPPWKQRNGITNERLGNTPTLISSEATIVEKSAKLTQFTLGTSQEMKSIIKYSKLAGKACVIVDLGINIYRAAERDITWTSAMMRTGMSGVEYLSFSIPYAGVFIGGTLLYLDITGHFDNTLYDTAWLKKNFTPAYTNYEKTPLYYRHGK